MRTTTRLTLVLLRLAIGWHFLFEGMEKIRSIDLGPTEWNRQWTSAGYLHDAPGPIRPWLRGFAKANDDWLRQDFAGGQKSGQLPSILASGWEKYRARFMEHYRIHDDPKLKDLVLATYEQAQLRAVHWLTEGHKRVEKIYPSGTVVAEASTLDRIASYHRQLARIDEMENGEFPAFGKDVRHSQFREAKAEADRLHAELSGEWSAQTAAMHADLEHLLDDTRRALGPMPEDRQASPVEWVDRGVAWSLTIIGGCLLLGIFAPVACLAGAAFLLLLYLAYPPWPWLAENFHAEGHYFIIDRNLIEMLALAALATVPSGRWAGFDGLLSLLWRRTPRGASPGATGKQS